MKLKKLLCIIFAVLMVLTVGCGKKGAGDDSSSTPSDTTQNVRTSISLLWSADDTLDPYTAKTELNRKLSLLMFDPLVKLDGEFQPQLILIFLRIVLLCFRPFCSPR